MSTPSPNLSATDLRSVVRVAADLADAASQSQALTQIGDVISVLNADTAILGEVSVAPEGRPVVGGHDEPGGWFVAPARAAFAFHAEEHPLVI